MAFIPSTYNFDRESTMLPSKNKKDSSLVIPENVNVRTESARSMSSSKV